MLEITNLVTSGWETAIRGMRNPKSIPNGVNNSWDKADSYWVVKDGILLPTSPNDFVYKLGHNDFDLATRLIKAGPEHAKFLRMIHVQMDIAGPLYWWKEMDTYKVATATNSCSTMHRLTYKPFEMSDFSFEHLIGNEPKEYFDVESDFKEIFVDIQEHENYAISNKGRVWSKKRDKFLTPSVNSSDYKKVVLNGKNLYVHRLVAQAFCPNPNNLEEVNHIDGNKWNNNYTNLEWVDKSENAKHAFKIGLRTISGYTRYKVSQSSHRFTSDEIEEIKQLYYDGMSKQEIAKKFNCYSSTVCNILNNKTYREIEMTPYDTAKLLIDHLNELRDAYLKTKDKKYWWQMIQLLPSSYNQLRTWDASLQAILNILKQRKGHKLDEWHTFRRICFEQIPYCKEFYTVMTGDNDYETG